MNNEMNKEQQELLDEAFNQFSKYKMENFDDTRWDVIIEMNTSDNTKPYFVTGRPLIKEEFINKCKTDTEFSERWGLKIEERDLTTVRERKKYDDDLFGEYPDHHETLEYIFKRGVPRKLITITYNDKTIESYE
jgi:hypothetical protein